MYSITITEKDIDGNALLGGILAAVSQSYPFVQASLHERTLTVLAAKTEDDDWSTLAMLTSAEGWPFEQGDISADALDENGVFVPDEYCDVDDEEEDLGDRRELS
jgi:hypothetical protein